ncbi:MAG TPA: MMPL family transporter, partial [Kaistiaceae bacterium]|nr:MMPL family transporter [Kaistiaceae bacterium]
TVMPQEIPSGPDLDGLLAEIDKHPLGLGKLISKDRKAALVIVAVEPTAQDLDTAKEMNADLRELARESFEPLGIASEVTGIPVLRVELVKRLISDQARIIGLGIALVFVISALIFRSLVGALVTQVPAVVAVLWVMGLMGAFGVNINLTTTILPVLILILAFADSMHLTVHMLRAHVAGKSLHESAYLAVKEVGPACVLTSLTTAIAFLTLTFSDSFAIRELGLAGSMATLLSYAAVITVGPLLFVTIGRGPIAPPAETGRAFHWLGAFARHAGTVSWQRPVATAIVGLAVITVFAFGHSRLRPEFSFNEHLGEKLAPVQAMARINHEFGGSNPVHVMVPLPQPGGITAPANLDVVRRIHLALTDFSGSNSVLSFWSIVKWLGGEADPEAIRERLDELLEAMPESWRSRLFTPDGSTALVTVYFGDEGAAATLARLTALEAQTRAAVPEMHVPVRATGFLAVSSRESDRMIMQLNLSLVAAVFFNIVLISLAFRSVRVGVISLFPNLLPILATGTYLVVSGHGLQFASAIALTIAFGIAVDDTVHFLNRYRLDRATLPPVDAVRIANVEVGPVLVTTSIVLCVGLALTFISQLPMLRLFGRLAIITLGTALLADLVLLPALLILADKRKKR